MDAAHKAIIERACGAPVVGTASLSGGCVADVREVRLGDGRFVVAKIGGPGASLDIEGRMLGYLASRSGLPVPEVLHAQPDLLVMERIEHDGLAGEGMQRHASELLAALHDIGPEQPGMYGLDFDTMIGPLAQQNAWGGDWAKFFGDMRLRVMADDAARSGGIGSALAARVHALADRVDDLIGEAGAPGLIHGDAWGGNILAHQGRVRALIDPAVYYADPEIELAFGTLFSTFGDAFFERYGQLRPIRAGFFEVRRDLYNLYPLLVHARLFGGGYGGSVERIVRGLGF